MYSRTLQPAKLALRGVRRVAGVVVCLQCDGRWSAALERDSATQQCRAEPGWDAQMHVGAAANTGRHTTFARQVQAGVDASRRGEQECT